VVLPKREMQRSNERCRDPTRALRPERERERERENSLREREMQKYKTRNFTALSCAAKSAKVLQCFT
jgi:hypothetical protein